MSLLALEQVLSEFRPDPESSRPLTVQKAIFLARCLQERAKELQTPPERRQQAELDRMLQTPSDKVTLALMTDQAFRTHDVAYFVV
jgi:RHH-type proline utilization regulon transcriptional repressor/proline dehydrogenase/delta 1-pyrroline-5-carboxylate dehydrogenase